MIRRRRGKKGRILQLTTTRDDTFYRVVRHNCRRENVQFLLEQLQGTKGSKVAAAITGSLLLSLSLAPVFTIFLFLPYSVAAASFSPAK